MLTIAGTSLDVRAGFPLMDVDDPVYLPFLSPEAADAAVAGVDASIVDIELLDTPSPSNDSPLLFFGVSWSMQREGEGYRVSFLRGSDGIPHTVLRSNSGTTRVKVHVSEMDVVPDSMARGQVLRRNPVCYPLDQVLMINHLAPRGGALVHAAGAVVDGRALVCPGVSRAGKSSISRLFVSAGLGDSLLSDDRIILRPVPHGAVDGTGLATGPGVFQAWGTPWPGDAHIAMNDCAPLAALLFLVKADATEIVPLTPGEAMRRLMPVVSCPWYDLERGNLVLETCARFIESVPSYDLRFRLDAEVVDLLTGRSWG